MKHDNLDEAVKRIQYMERLFDALLKDPSRREERQILTDYLESGQWLRDYELDEAGFLPPDLRRGVLSQDGLYNLLGQQTTVQTADTLL